MIGTPARSVPVVPAGAMKNPTCTLPPFITIWCDAPRVSVGTVPDGVAVRLRPGDPIRFAGETSDRVCTVSFFARASSGRQWALSGDACAAASGQQVYTFDGRRIGIVDRFLEAPSSPSEPAFRMPAISLDPQVVIESTLAGFAATTERVVVRVDGGNSRTEREVLDYGRTLGGTLRTSPPMAQPGDQGAPAIADGRLVGVLRSANDVTPASALIAALPALDPTAALVLATR